MRVAQQACFFRRAAYEKAGGLNRDLHCVMDIELWMRMFETAARWGHIPEYLAGYRWHSQAKMIGTTWAKKAEDERRWLRDTYPRYSDKSPRTRLSVPVYRLWQVLTGRYPRAAIETRRWRGKKLTDVFGEWNVAGCEGTRSPITSAS
jgi:hypothetical protein